MAVAEQLSMKRQEVESTHIKSEMCCVKQKYKVEDCNGSDGRRQGPVT